MAHIYDMLQESKNFLPELISRAAKPNMMALEVGSWTGQSTHIIGECVKKHNGLLFCVDWWRGSTSEPFLIEDTKRTNIFNIFESNMKEVGLDDTVQVLKMKSETAARILKDQFFDFIFIDGDHSYEFAKKDIIDYIPKLKPGGIFSGHDCEMKLADCQDKQIVFNYKDIGWYTKAGEDWIPGIGLHCGVIQAVGELLPTYEIQDRIFWFRS